MPRHGERETKHPGGHVDMDPMDRWRQRAERKKHYRFRRSFKHACEVIQCGDRGHTTRCTRRAAGWVNGRRVCQHHLTDARHHVAFTVEEAREHRAEARRARGERLELTRGV